MTREEVFQQALKDREIEKENAKNRGTFTFEEVDYTALEEGNYRVLRFLGNPISQRQGDKYSPKIVHRSEIVADNSKKMKVNWPSREENENWILYKIMDKILSYKWNKDANKREYFYETKHPDLFQAVLKNNGTHQFSQGWKPKALAVINVIDRGRMEWHRENKKTLILSRKMTEGDNGGEFYDFGIPFTTYNMIFDNIVGYAGDWEYYDLLVTRTADDPYYNIFHSVVDKPKFWPRLEKQIKGSIEYADTPLTEEELSWQRVDIDKITKITTYKKIQDRLKIFIAHVDSVFKTKFSEELEKLVEIEKQQTANQPEEVEESDERVEVKEASSVKEARRPVPVKEAPMKVNYDDLRAKGFKGIDHMTDEMKELVIGIDSKDQLLYSEAAGVNYDCTDDACTAYKSPQAFTHCPKCAVKF